MAHRTNVPPSTVGVRQTDTGIEVRYLDGRRVTYRGKPTPVEGRLTTPPGKEVHVLVTDDTGTEGVLVYVNDLDTHDEVLESTGVGRILLDRGESTELFPGVTVERAGHSIEIDADRSVIDGTVFVFAEDEFSEHSYELVQPE